MQSLFQTYLELGFSHILDINGYDHIVFVIALCAIYKWQEWKTVAILVTAFTIGHSITLALAAFDLIRFPAKVIELLIPVTIIITSLHNVFPTKTYFRTRPIIQFNYLFALFFGLIHGMGFSNFLRSILTLNEQGKLVQQLFAFNIGLEIGQLLIVGIILLVTSFFLSVLKIKQGVWTIFLSGATMGIGVILLLNVWAG